MTNNKLSIEEKVVEELLDFVELLLESTKTPALLK